MKFSIQREALLKPLQHVIGVVERRQTLPVLGNVLLNATKKNVKLTATDLEVELQAQVNVAVTEVGDITLPARKLLDICRTLPEEAQLDISVKKDRCLVSSGKSRFTLSTLPASEFPVIDKLKTPRKFSLPENELHRLLESTGFAMAQQDVRYYLNGLMLEPEGKLLRAVATDGHRLALCELAASVGDGESQQVIVPRKGVQELQRLLEHSDNDVSVEISSNHIRITTAELRFTSKLIDGRFPEYSAVIPVGTDRHIKVDRGGFTQALQRASILSNEKYRGIRLIIRDSGLVLQAHNPEQEEAEETVPVQYEGDSLEIGFNVSYLLDVLGVLSGEQIKLSLSDPNSSALVEESEEGDSVYVVMPMRL